MYSCQLASLLVIIGKSEKTRNDCRWKTEKQKQETGLKESWGKKEFSEIDDVVSDVNVFFFLLMSFNFLFLKKK